MPAAMHLRTQIRDAAASVVTGLSSTGTRVHTSYMTPRELEDLPCLMVKSVGVEQIVGATVAASQERDMPLTITGYVKSSGDVDAALNQIALEVETVIAATPTLSGKCTRIELDSIESGLDQSMEKPVGRIDIGFRVKYFTAAGAPGTLI